MHQHEAILRSLRDAGFRPEFTRTIETRLRTGGGYIGFSADPGWGPRGWWYEADTIPEIRAMATREWQWDHDGEVPFEFVAVNEVALLEGQALIDFNTAAANAKLGLESGCASAGTSCP